MKRRQERIQDEEDEDIFSTDDIPDVKQIAAQNVDFANLLLDKHEFVKSLPQNFQSFGILIEKNIALANLSDVDVSRTRHKLNDITNSFLMTMPPRFHTFKLMYEIESAQLVGDLETTRAKGGMERRLLATQLSESTVNSYVRRDGDQPPTTWLGRFAKSFRK